VVAKVDPQVWNLASPVKVGTYLYHTSATSVPESRQEEAPSSVNAPQRLKLWVPSPTGAALAVAQVSSRDALQGVRRALIEFYGATGVDPDAPQEVARRFGINRNLTWKLSRVTHASDPFATLNHLPGNQGMELAIKAFEKAGAPAESVGQLRSAMQQLISVIDEHAGDREHIELTLESMGVFKREALAESGRELAFRGTSMIWGVQARTRVAMGFLAPSKGGDSGDLDYVMIAGLVGFRRLRASAQWRLHRAQIHDDKGGNLRLNDRLEEIEPKKPGDTPMMFSEFCSPNMPAMQSVPGPDGHEFILPGGQVGNRAAFDSYFGYIYRGLSGVKSVANEFGSVAAALTLPVESMVFDLMYHRDVPIPDNPELLVYGFPHGGPDDPTAQAVQNLLPISEIPAELAGSPPALATPLVPKITKIAERVYARMGWNASEFRGLRVHLRYPPMSTKVVMRWPLK